MSSTDPRAEGDTCQRCGNFPAPLGSPIQRRLDALALVVERYGKGWAPHRNGWGFLEWSRNYQAETMTEDEAGILHEFGLGLA